MSGLEVLHLCVLGWEKRKVFLFFPSKRHLVVWSGTFNVTLSLVWMVRITFFVFFFNVSCVNTILMEEICLLLDLKGLMIKVQFESSVRNKVLSRPMAFGPLERLPIAAWVPLCGVLGAGQRERTLCRPRNKESLQEKSKRRQSAKTRETIKISLSLRSLLYFTFSLF